MSVRLNKYSYRFAEEVFNGKVALKNELEGIIFDSVKDLSILSRPIFNKTIEENFKSKGWISQPKVFNETDNAYARFDFLKDRIGVEVQFGHASTMGTDLLKFQIASYSNLDRIDFGVYITTTDAFQKYAQKEFGHNWSAALTFEKVVRYLPHIRSAIQVPVYVIGIDI